MAGSRTSTSARPPRAETPAWRATLLGTFPGRALVAGAAVKVVVASIRSIVGELPAFLLVVDTIAGLALAAACLYFLFKLSVLAKRRLLWRVRRKLILSYIFIGFVPALLIVAFFLLCGFLLFNSFSSYLVQSRLRALTEQARFVAAGTALEIQRGGGRDVAEVLARKAANYEAQFPGLSVAAVPIGHACGGTSPAPAPAARTARHRGTVGARGSSRGDTRVDRLRRLRGCARVYAPQQPRRRRRRCAPAGEKRGLSGHAAAQLRDRGRPSGRREDQAGAPSGNRRRAPERAAREPDRSAARWPRNRRAGAAVGPRARDSGQHGDARRLRGLEDRRPRHRRDVDADEYGRDLQPRVRRPGPGRVAKHRPAPAGGPLPHRRLFLVIEFFALIAGFALARSITGSVHELFIGTERVRQGDFTHKIAVRREDQLGELADRSIR